MFNFIKRYLVRFLTRKVLLVSNRTTQEYFILSHVSSDGYVVLMTSFKTYLPVSYKIYKRMFQPVSELIDIGDEILVVGVYDDIILLEGGHSVKLADINETDFEESIDTSF